MVFIFTEVNRRPREELLPPNCPVIFRSLDNRYRQHTYRNRMLGRSCEQASTQLNANLAPFFQIAQHPNSHSPMHHRAKDESHLPRPTLRRSCLQTRPCTAAVPKPLISSLSLRAPSDVFDPLD